VPSQELVLPSGVQEGEGGLRTPRGHPQSYHPQAASWQVIYLAEVLGQGLYTVPSTAGGLARTSAARWAAWGWRGGLGLARGLAGSGDRARVTNRTANTSTGISSQDRGREAEVVVCPLL